MKSVNAATAIPAPLNRAPHLYADLADSVARLIERSTLRPGHRVPSVRRMAAQKGVSVSTVLQAYTRLEDSGYLEARPQSGYYVRPRLLDLAPEPRQAKPMARPSFVGVGDLAGEILASASDPTYVQFGAACPDPSLFPTQRLARLLSGVCRDDPALIGRYCLDPAHPPLAREIARRYLHAGAALDHDELVVTVGCAEAIHLGLRAVAHPGDTIALESPAYYGFLSTIQSLGLKALEIPVDPRSGICLEAARDALSGHKVKAMLVMPSFHNPLGTRMSDQTKERLYALLTEFDIPAIEDDIYGDLHFEGRRPKPLKAWDTDGRVILCGSFSKTLAPGFRVGWCAPGRYLERVRRLKFTTTVGTPVVLQKAITAFLRGGGYDHHLRSIRKAYRTQLDVFSESILRHFPAGTRLSRPQGGFVLWVEMPGGIDAIRLRRAALARKINLAPGPLFSVKDRYRNCLRINCGVPWTETVAEAVRTVGRLAASQLVESIGSVPSRLP